MNISENGVLVSLRGALAASNDVWRSARYVCATEAERSGRTIVAAARTTDFTPLRELAGVELHPYGVHHHVLLVGWKPAQTGVHIDSSRFSERIR